MPITYRARDAANERFMVALGDWTRKLMQLATIATVLLYGYLIYGLFLGGVGDWGTVPAADRPRLLANVQGAVLYVNVALGILLLCVCFLFYDEEPTGYAMVAVAVFLYYGMPFLLDQLMPGKLAQWMGDGKTPPNQAALAVLGQFRLAGIVIAMPGGILLLRDVFLRIVDGARRKNEDFTAMQYGGAVKEEAPVGSAIIGTFAKCWQLPFCRDAIRRRCPIYHARSRCWKERVGCMCEENVIRHAMDALINKEIMTFEKLPEKKEAADDLITTEIGSKPEPEKTEELPPRAVGKIDAGKVKIPYNTTLPDLAKRERCRNCVIYNEHQRLKYQFLAPIVVLAVPALAYVKMDVIAGAFHRLLFTMDKLMASLSLDPNARNTGAVSSIASSSDIAQYLVIGCLVVIVTTMALRALEYTVFKLKI